MSLSEGVLVAAIILITLSSLMTLHNIHTMRAFIARDTVYRLQRDQTLRHHEGEFTRLRALEAQQATTLQPVVALYKRALAAPHNPYVLHWEVGKGADRLLNWAGQRMKGSYREYLLDLSDIDDDHAKTKTLVVLLGKPYRVNERLAPYDVRLHADDQLFDMVTLIPPEANDE